MVMAQGRWREDVSLHEGATIAGYYGCVNEIIHFAHFPTVVLPFRFRKERLIFFVESQKVLIPFYIVL